MHEYHIELLLVPRMHGAWFLNLTQFSIYHRVRIKGPYQLFYLLPIKHDGPNRMLDPTFSLTDISFLFLR